MTDAELDSLYGSAIALIFPSLAEGFGLPILEAMQVGCAVATSNVSSMPEIGGDCALYFDPNSEHSISEAMQALLSDSASLEKLRAEGPAHAHLLQLGSRSKRNRRDLSRDDGIEPHR